MTNYQISDLKPGLKINCNGYPATIAKMCDGQLAGMVEVRLNSGLVCVSASELIRFQNHKAGR